MGVQWGAPQAGLSGLTILFLLLFILILTVPPPTCLSVLTGVGRGLRSTHQ